MSPKKTSSGAASAMKQSTLSFNTAKRTGSTAATGKPQAKAGSGGSIAAFFNAGAASAAAPPPAPPQEHAQDQDTAEFQVQVQEEAAQTPGSKRPSSSTKADTASSRLKAKDKPTAKDTDADYRDDIEPADDFDADEDEDVEYIASDTESSVSTFETVEEKPVSVVQGRTTRAQAAAAETASPAGKNVNGNGSGIGGIDKDKDVGTPIQTPTPKKRKVIKDEVVDEIESAGEMDVDDAGATGKDAGMFKPSNRTEDDVAKRVEANARLESGVKATLNGNPGVKDLKAMEVKEDKEKEKAVEKAMEKENENEKEPTQLKVKAIKWRKYLDKLKEKYGDVSDSESLYPSFWFPIPIHVHSILRLIFCLSCAQ
uniref:Uncharacterized protein n=1 Tax=Psilocybe cubensis TaxID=181762 RepID=A0A8H7XSV5_PSICU